MACYPIILFIAGLQNLDDTVVLSDKLNHLIESCKNACNGESDSNFPIPYRLTNFPNYNEKFDDLNYDDDDINYGDSIESDIMPVSLNDDESKKLMKLDATKYQVKTKSIKLEPEFKNFDQNEDFDDKTLLRERQNVKSTAIPIVNDEKTLLKILKNRVPLIAVSNNLIKHLTNMKYREIINNPLFNLSPETLLFGKKKSFFGVPTLHLAYLIVDTFKNLHDTGSKSFKPFLKHFGNILEAALEFIEEPKQPVAEEKRGGHL